MNQRLCMVLCAGTIGTLTPALHAQPGTAPYSTVPSAAPTDLFYNAATGQFVGSGSLTSLLYQQRPDPGQLSLGIGPQPPPIPPPGIDRTFAIDDIHFASPGTHHVTSFAFGLYIAPGSSGTFNTLVRAYENNAANSILPDEVGGAGGKIYSLQISGMTGQPGTYRVVVFNADFYSTQHLWLGLSTPSIYAWPIIAGDAVELGTSSDLIAWEGWPGDQTYTPGTYTFGSGGPKADLTFEIGGTLEAPADFKWFGELFHDGPTQIDSWTVAHNWRKLVGGSWVVAPVTPGVNDTITFDSGWPNLRLPAVATSNLASGFAAAAGSWNFLGYGGGQGQMRLGTLTVGDVASSNNPEYIVGDALDQDKAGYLTVTGATLVRRGRLVITLGSAADLAALTVGTTLAGYVEPDYLTDAAATSVTSLNVPSGHVMVYRGGTFANSGATTLGSNVAGIGDPGISIGDAADEFSPGTATTLGDVTLITGTLAVRHPGSSLTIGLASNRKNLVIGDPSSPAEASDPGYLVEHFASATIHRQITLRRGHATVRSGGSVTTTLGGTNPGVLINGTNESDYLVGDASGPGTLTAAGIVRVTQGTLRLGHDEAQVFAGTLDVQTLGTLSGRGKVHVTSAVTLGGSLSPGEEVATGWGSVAGHLDFRDTPNLTLGAGAVTTMDLGSGRGVSDLVTTTGDLTPGGILVLRPIDGDVPQVGEVIPILQAATALQPGEFAVVDDTLMRQAGRRATVEYTSGAVNAVVLCHADYNGDGFLDGIDYDLFNNDFESYDPLQQIHADYSGDSFVDGIDYDLFNADFEHGC